MTEKPEHRHLETSVDATGVARGHRETRIGEGPWTRLPHSDWVRYPLPTFAKGPEALLVEMGIHVGPKRAQEFEIACDSNYPSYYYLAVAARDGAGDEALKWVMGAMAAELNVSKLPFSSLPKLLPAIRLNEFVLKLNSGAIDRNFAKQIFGEMLTTTIPLDDLIADPRFKAADDSAVDDALDEIIAANPDQFEKAKENPKVVQWFVGQVMKATQGKAKPPAVIEKMAARLEA